MRGLSTIVVAIMWLVAVAQPRVEWLELEHDFGIFSEDVGRVSCELRMVNVGDAPLLVERVRTSCGCTAADYPRTAIAPGDTAAVRITYTATGRPGAFDKGIWVNVNGEPRLTQLHIKGRVIGAERTIDKMYPVRLGAARLGTAMKPMGEMKRGTHRTVHINGINPSLDTLLLRVTLTPDHIKASVEPDTVAPGDVFIVSMGYETNLAPQWGFNSDEVVLESEPLHPSETSVAGMARVEVMAQVDEDFSRLSDEELRRAPVAQLPAEKVVRLGTVEAGTVVTARFEIVNKGRSPLSVRRLWTPAHGVTATSDTQTVKPGKRTTVTVKFDTRLFGKPLLNDKLTIITNDPANPSQVMRIVAEVK